MTGWSRCLSLAALVLFVLLQAAGCSAGGESSSGEPAPEETTAPSVRGQTIVVATNAAYPPFEFAPNDGPRGFDIDLMDEISERAGFEVRYRNVQFDSIIRGVGSEIFDAAISGMTITEDRTQQADFSDPYYNVTEALVVSNGSNIESTDDLSEVAIGVQEGTMGQKKAAELLSAGDVKRVYPFRTVDEAFTHLEGGGLQGVIYDLPAAQRMVEKSGGELDLVEVIPTEEQYGIAFPPESPLIDPVNEALAEIKEDGTYEEIYEKWIGRAPEEIP